jgi:hypothetical protein
MNSNQTGLWVRSSPILSVFGEKKWLVFVTMVPGHQTLFPLNIIRWSFFAVFLMAYTLPMLYEKYEDQVDVVGEKAQIEIKKQYAVLDAKFLSKVPMLSDKKQHWTGRLKSPLVFMVII